MGGGQSQDKDAGTSDKAAKTAEAGEKPPEKAAAKAKNPDKVPLDPHAMAARIEAAERQNRRLRRRSWVVGLLAVLALVVGAAALLAPYNTRVRWALDRVIRAGRYWVPQWYLASHRIAYWDVFARPERQPRYYRGIPDTWWADPAKAKQTEQKG
jgi:hypothetical protein